MWAKIEQVDRDPGGDTIGREERQPRPLGLILVIDDEVEVREELTRALEAAEHEVLEAEDGRSGLEAAKNYAPDAVILDVNLPDMDSFQVLTLFRDDRAASSLPVIMITDKPTPTEKKKALDLNVLDYLEKPLESSDVELRVLWALKAGSTQPAVPWDQAGALAKTMSSDLGSGSGSGGSGSSSSSSEDAAFVAEEGENVRAITPEKGGTVEVEDGAMEVSVPAGAVPDTVGLHVKRGDHNSKPEPGVMRMRVGKNATDIRLSDKTGAPINGMKLKKPAKIGIKVSKEELGRHAQRPVRVQEYDHDSGKWVDVDSSVDTATGMAYAEKSRFPRTVKKRKAARVIVLDPADREYEKVDVALEGSGFNILRETIPSKIKERILGDRPIVVILGLIFAGQQGTRILRQIKTDRQVSETSVILIGHPDDPTAYAGAIDLGARDVIPGPVQMGELQYRVGRAYEAAVAKQRRLGLMSEAPKQSAARDMPRPGRRPSPAVPGARRASRKPSSQNDRVTTRSPGRPKPIDRTAGPRRKPEAPGRKVRRAQGKPAA